MNQSRKRKALEEMDVMDDFMITELVSHPTEGKKFARTLLSVLLQRKIGDITVQAQSVFQGDTPELRGIRLDVEITEKIDSSPGNGERAACRIYDVEAQNSKVSDLPRRSRFYQAKLDSKGLESGEKNWCNLPDLYVIMISNFDPFGYDYMMYTIHNKCVELPELEYKDGLKYIYFYTKGTKGGSEEIKALLSYLRHSIIENVTDEATQSIHDVVEKIKQSAEVRGKYMTIGEIMDYNKAVGYAEGREEGLAAGRAEGLTEGRVEGRADGICETLRLLSWSDEEILQKLMEMCDLSREEALVYLDRK